MDSVAKFLDQPDVVPRCRVRQRDGTARSSMQFAPSRVWRPVEATDHRAAVPYALILSDRPFKPARIVLVQDNGVLPAERAASR